MHNQRSADRSMLMLSFVPFNDPPISTEKKQKARTICFNRDKAESNQTSWKQPADVRQKLIDI